MKLHAQTIANAERWYANKAEAYFYGLFGGFLAGYLAGVITFTLLAVVMSWFTRGGK